MSNKRQRVSTTGFSSIASKADLVEKCGEGILPQPGVHELKVDLTLSDETIKHFLVDSFIPQLTLAAWLLRIRSHQEKVRHLLVYDILKEFLRFGRGRHLLSVDPSTVSEVVSASPKTANLFVGFEEHLKHGQMHGNIEFLVRDGPDEDASIKFVVEVKPTLSPEMFHDKSIWQFFAELITASNFNLSNDETAGVVWGALTDAYSWYFFKLTRQEDSYKIDRSDSVMLFHPSVQPTFTTIQCLCLFFSALFPDLSSLTESELTEARDRIDKDVALHATAFNDNTLLVSRLQKAESELSTVKEENAKLKRKLAKRRHRT